MVSGTPYRSGSISAYEEVKRLHTALAEKDEEISRLTEVKSERRSEVRRIIVEIVLVVLAIFAYVVIGGLTAGWTRYEFSRLDNTPPGAPGTSRLDTAAGFAGVFWPIGVLINVGHYAYRVTLPDQEPKEK